MIIGLKTRHIVQSRYACWPKPYGKTHERRMNTRRRGLTLPLPAWLRRPSWLDFGAEGRQPKTAERDGKLAQEIAKRHVAHRPESHSRERGGHAEHLRAMTLGKAAGEKPSEVLHSLSPFQDVRAWPDAGTLRQ
jgi:hypothetical protein